MNTNDLTDRLIAYKYDNPHTFAKNITDDSLRNDLLTFPVFAELPIAQKASAIILGFVPKCECGAPVKYMGKIKDGIYGTPFGGWHEFCSRLCMQKSPSTIEKRKQTNIERFGTASWAQSVEGKTKLSEKWSDERKKNYNEAMTATCLKRFGATHHTKTQAYINTRNATVLMQTDGKYYNHFQDVSKIKESNNRKYKKDYWTMTDEGRKSCSINNAMKNAEIALKSRLIRMSSQNRYDQILLDILIKKDKIAFKQYVNSLATTNGFAFRQQIAKHLDISTTYLNALFRKFDMSNEYLTLGKSTSYAEHTVFEFLDSIGLQVKRKDKTILEGLEIDLLIESHKLGIEYDGIRYHSENYGGKDKYYHVDKTNLAESKGYQLLHIFENEWQDLQKRKIWKSIIKAKCGLLTSRIYARKCVMQKIEPTEAKRFLNDNHLAGFIGATTHVGLFHNDELVSVISYGKSRFSKNETEIYRFASKLETIVVGGLSKLLSSIKEDNLVTFADRRFSTIGAAYSKQFDTVDIIDPGWYGFDCGSYALQHRLNFTKQKLKVLLGEAYDETKTAIENMFNNNMDRIFDCGHFKYSLRK